MHAQTQSLHTTHDNSKLMRYELGTITPSCNVLPAKTLSTIMIKNKLASSSFC